MAKSKPQQGQLIEVDHPSKRKLKKALSDHDGAKEEGKVIRKKMRDLRTKALEIVRDEMGVKPDSKDGFYHVIIDGEEVSIGQAEAQLTVKRKTATPDQTGDDSEDGDNAEGAEPSMSERKER